MCLGIPGKVVATYREHDLRMGRIQRRQQASLFGACARSSTRRLCPGSCWFRPVSNRRIGGPLSVEFLLSTVRVRNPTSLDLRHQLLRISSLLNREPNIAYESQLRA
jgi:hypothetical protein